MASLEQLSALCRDTVAVHLTTDRIAHIRGEDARSWLSGQVTADLRPLTAEHAVYALAVTVKGRIVTDLWAVERDGIAMVLPALTAEDTLAALEKHIIMEDAELEPDATLRVLSLQGPRARDVCEAAGLEFSYGASRLSDAGIDVWLATSALADVMGRVERAVAAVGGAVIDESAWNALHVALAVPRAGVDFNGDAYPQEAGLKSRAVAFNKGCYLGQEVVYMLENRGQLARRLVQLRGPAEALVPGALVSDGEGKKAGQITSSVREADGSALALAYARKSMWDVGQALVVDGAVVHVTHVVGMGSVTCPVIAS